MIPELGQLCLALALALCVFQALLPFLLRTGNAPQLRYLTKPTAVMGFLLTFGAFSALVVSYALSDFSVLNVVLNSHSAKPMLYKITGTWGNHEGSMLLWALILATYASAVAVFPARDMALKTTTLSVLGAIQGGFLTFLLFTSNPFARVWPPAAEGEDLNPLLQDIGLALHPPTLYLGYVGLGVVFAYAMAGLIRGKLDSEWARTAHPFILLPWSFLTLGIGAGSWWAYRELGWGGWWFWDPVENVSLLPWLAATALLHANIVLEKRGALPRWVALLAIMSFSFSLIGTFIVRSGLITSVHAFASDPARGLFILFYIAVVTGAALYLYGRSEIQARASVSLQSRAGFMLMGNLLLVIAAITVLIAILYPVFLQLIDAPSISVGPQYFNTTFLPLTAPLLVLAALAPLMSWDRTSNAQLFKYIKILSPALFVALAISIALTKPFAVTIAAGIALGAWLLYGTARYAWMLQKPSLRSYASVLAHAGMAIFVLGITATGGFKETHEAVIKQNTPLQLGEYTLTLTSAKRRAEYNYTVREGVFSVTRNGEEMTVLKPQLRDYPVRQMQTTEASIYSTPRRDLYLVLGDAGSGHTGVRLYVTPGQQWIWAGFLLVALGGFVALIASVRKRRPPR